MGQFPCPLPMSNQSGMHDTVNAIPEPGWVLSLLSSCFLCGMAPLRIHMVLLKLIFLLFSIPASTEVSTCPHLGQAEHLQQPQDSQTLSPVGPRAHCSTVCNDTVPTSCRQTVCTQDRRSTFNPGGNVV